MAESAFSALQGGRPVQPASVGGMSNLRLIDLNLFYTIKEKILPANGYVNSFTETITPSTQTVDPNTGLTVTPYIGEYNDWVYFNPDNTNPALTGLLTQPTLSTSGSLAYINYPEGKVFYSGIQSASITVTYDYYDVYVQDGFPDWGEDLKDFDDMKLPMVSIDYMSRKNIPFYIGGRYEEDRTFVIDVLANSDVQRDDIMDLLEDSLRYDYTTPLDYRNGFPLGFNGDKNLAFDRGSANLWLPFRFKDASSRVIRNPIATDKFRHRSVLNVTVEQV